jgi:hypothetical protein
MFIRQQKNSHVLKNFTIFGERHSGTNFLERLITSKDSWGGVSTNKAFDVPITWEYGSKHFFGFHDDLLINSNSNNTLFLGIVRNPYDWLMAMYKMPHHIRDHRGPKWSERFDSIEDFLTNNDLVARYTDPALYNNINLDINPYTFNGYKNIFELRQVKLHYLLYMMPLLVENYTLIKYEELSNNSIKFIQDISSYYNIPIYHHIDNVHNLSRYTIDSHIKEFINNSIDWSLENMCGYYLE